jgi:hypothetical protein
MFVLRLHGQSRASVGQAFAWGVAEHAGGQTLINFVTEHRGDVSFNLARVSVVAKVLISGEDLCLNLAGHILISAGKVATRRNLMCASATICLHCPHHPILLQTTNSKTSDANQRNPMYDAT